MTSTMDTRRPIALMGIINATPDSFFAQSRYNFAILDDMPDIVDIGAVSTRPGSTAPSEEEEWQRLEPVLKAVSGRFPISIDTYRAGIVQRAYDLIGEFTVNDISAGEDDSMMLPLVGKLGLPYVAMHKRGNPQTMDSLCDYDDVVEDVLRYFDEFAVKAEYNGIADWIVDPGFGFAKTKEQNLQLLDGLERFRKFGKPVLAGVADKRFTEGDTEGIHLRALRNGADILRVHDVKKARQTVELYCSSI